MEDVLVLVGKGGGRGGDKRGWVERVEGDLRSLFVGVRWGFCGFFVACDCCCDVCTWTSMLFSSYVSLLLDCGAKDDGGSGRDDEGDAFASVGAETVYSEFANDKDKGGKTGAEERCGVCADAGAARSDWDGTYECLRFALPSFAALSACTAVLKRFQKLGSWTIVAMLEVLVRAVVVEVAFCEKVRWRGVDVWSSRWQVCRDSGCPWALAIALLLRRCHNPKVCLA